MKTFLILLLSLVFVSCEEKPVEVSVEEVTNLNESPEEVIEDSEEKNRRRGNC